MSLSEQKDNPESLNQKTASESEDDLESQNKSEEQRSYLSMALSVVLTSILIETVSLLSGLIVGVALWFVFAFIISMTFMLLGWGRNPSDNKQNNLDDVDILKEAYRRDLIDEEQLEDSLEANINRDHEF